MLSLRGRQRYRRQQFVDPQPRNEHDHGVSDSVRRRGHARSERYGRIHEPISLRSLPRSGPAYVVQVSLCCPPIRSRKGRPRSRVAIWVAYREGGGNLSAPPPGATATLLDSGYNTGPAGDTWPAVNLAQVSFIPVGAAHPPRALTTRETPLTIADPLDITQDADQDDTTASVTPDQGVIPEMHAIAQGPPARNLL